MLSPAGFRSANKDLVRPFGLYGPLALVSTPRGVGRSERHAPKEEASASSPCRVSQTRTRPPPSSQPPPFPHFVFHTMTTRASEVKNIWIAAGDGDLERVKVRLGRLAGLPGPKGR